MSALQLLYHSVASLQGFLFALVSALSAEVVFQHFLTDPSRASSLGRVVILFLTLFVIQRFALETVSSHRRQGKDMLLLVGVLITFIFIEWIGRIMRLSIASYAGSSAWLGQLDASSLYYAMPYAAGGLLLQILVGLNYSLVFAVALAVIVSTYSSGEVIAFPLVLVTNLVACLSLRKVRSRSAYLRAGLNIGLTSMAFAIGSVLVQGGALPTEVAVRVVCAFAGGILCTFVALGLTPVLEYLGGYVTDMRLIEMATLDHPLLKGLSIQAPGTWNHSMVMGMMAETAADAIGANSVLARVASYFHDVGKMKKPLYFVENQLSGENRHDKLSPSMSALIIKSHVKEGMELAKKHALPQAILDMIAQHHGTSVIEYFYEKAIKEAETQEGVVVDKTLYTYPGPKPQTREAGILMLADGVEAASRTLSEPTADRIQGMVQKMINKVFASGELSECDLTLRDLHLIAKSFTRVLTSIHHQRVAYSEPAEKVSTTGTRDGKEESRREKDVAGASGGKATSVSGEQDRGKEGSKENLKRLGL
jgi:cyclic-di-AMP phosphodiesterase PgpH